jgi:3-hydroxyacyl-[acyl-carrier-protein] dehydratase
VRFFMIDKITRWDVGKAATGIKNIALSEDFFDDHFPRRPVMPGVLIIEGLAQLSGLLLEASLKATHNTNAKAILTIMERTKFRKMVRPGDTLSYETELLSVNKTGGKVSARALRDGQVVVTTGLTFGFKYVDDPELETRRKELMAVWLADLETGE